MIFKKDEDKKTEKEDVLEETKNVEKPEKERDNKDLNKCRETLEKIEKEKAEFLAGWQRERADFLNYKKEQSEVFESIKKIIRENLILKILPILDYMDMAIIHLPDSLKEDKWVEGIIKTRDQFLGILNGEGVEAIKSISEEFNPELHDAIEEIVSDEKEGVVVEEVQKGYLMNGKLIRAARVKVSAKKKEGADS
jgi:molecular chaperone GrpE